jgi:phage recombination protein Bet
MTNVAVIPRSDDELLPVLRSSLYPGAADDSIRLVLGYCKAAGLDPMAKPVHIVPMYDKKSGGMRDVVMPGIDLYRVKAARTGQYAGCSEPEFGPDVTQTLGGAEVTFPAWCKVTVRRKLGDTVAEFTAVERWIENYATKRNDSAQPNAMWSKRPYGQLAKCAEAQALRKGFPEIGSGPTAEEMAGKSIDADYAAPAATLAEPDDGLMTAAREAAMSGTEAFRAYWKALAPIYRTQLQASLPTLKEAAQAADARTVDEPPADDATEAA